MKQIPLTQGKFAIVDDADFEWLNQRKWTARENKKGSGLWYAYRQEIIDGKTVSIQMHREILGLIPFDGVLTDHQNGIGLDNQRHNIRRATKAQNGYNARLRRDNTTGHKGIFRIKKTGNFMTYINHMGKRIYLKVCHTLDEAIEVRRIAQEQMHGEFAR